MNTINKTLLALLMAALAAGGWWLAAQREPHRRQLERRTDATGQVYYTCAMHPEVRQDVPGNCPICGMKLVRREEAGTGHATEPKAEREVLYWYDPMKPEVHFDASGKSPFMDMDLVPKHADAAGDENRGTVTVDPAMVQNLGVRSVELGAGTFWQRVDAVGQVRADERRMVTVEARAAGWVESLEVSAVGDPVRKGQRLASLYSPELYAASQELELARASGDATLIGAARERLRLLGGQVGAGSRTPVTAPRSGYVAELMVRQGAQLAPGMALMKLADLSSVWLIVEVPEALAGWVRAGQPAEARFRAWPGELFEGTVDYLYPELDPATRTLRVRLVFDNADGRLRPGMFADATIFGGARHEVLLAPSEALIRTGRRNVVIVDEGGGRFRPVEVVPGRERDGQVEIVEGLNAGQRVVVSGQFLIDSEASLQGAFKRMTAVETPTDHHAQDPVKSNGANDLHIDHEAHTGHGDHAHQGMGPAETAP